MSQTDRKREASESRDAKEQLQDLPTKSVEGVESDQVRGGADPINGGKLGMKPTVPPIAG
jgi:hypothetical protein